MQSRARTVLTVVVCALIVVCPITNPVTADTISWISDVSGVWDNPAHWDGIFPPGSSDDAKHTTKFNHIQVNSDEACLSFVGKGGPTDRFLLIEEANTWTIGAGGLSNDVSGGNFMVKLEDGTSAGAPTIFETINSGDVNEIDFVKSETLGKWIKFVIAGDLIDSTLEVGNESILDIAGDLTDTSVAMGDKADVDVGGGIDGSLAETFSVGNQSDVLVDGDVTDVNMTFGDSGSEPITRTSVAIGSSGGPEVPFDHGDWTIKSSTDVLVDKTYGSGDFHGRDVIPTVTMEGDATMTVEGVTTDYTWELSDTAGFTGEDTIIEGVWNMHDSSTVDATTIEGGTWVLEDLSTVDVSDDVNGGIWTIQDRAVLNVADVLQPDEMTLDGALVTCGQLSASLAPWDATIKNGAEIEADDAVWFGDNDDASSLTYLGLNNTVTLTDGSPAPFLFIGGDLNRGSGTSELDISTGYLVVRTRSVKVVEGSTVTRPYEPEGVSVEIRAMGCPVSWLEGVGPDYVGFNDDAVLFRDSPCVGRWAEVNFTNDAMQAQCAQVFDLYASTPISGGGGSTYRDAVYAVDITIGSLVILETGPQIHVNLYYTGTYTNNGTIQGLGTVTQLTPTLYGDFDGDGDGDDTDDETRFNDAWDSEQNDENYDPLVDWDCDGDVDCDDRDQYLVNYSGATLDGSCE